MSAFKTCTLEKGRYIPHNPNAIIAIFKNHFEDFKNNYPAHYKSEYGKYRLDRIVEFVEGLLVCGDYTKGIARIQGITCPIYDEVPGIPE